MISTSEFNELVKTFEKSRNYVRDFFVYGYKSRNDFDRKSARTYDNERRRIESWLSEYITSTNTKSGKSISLSIDSNLLDSNPLYAVWKSKSFTNNDIMLHFYILSVLQDKEFKSVEDITNEILALGDIIFDTQLVRIKLKDYAGKGILTTKKRGRELLYAITPTIEESLPSVMPNLIDALSFYQLDSPLGIVGSTLQDKLHTYNEIFRLKHAFFSFTLEDEILISILNGMNQKQSLIFSITSTKSNHEQIIYAIPLRIFISTKTGRRYVCVYQQKSKRFINIRLDSIHAITYNDSTNMYEYYEEKLELNLSNLWGVSFGNNHRLDYIKLTLFIDEKLECFIIKRLETEGKGGNISRIETNTFIYEKEVFDGNEMMPWIKTFIGRILSFESNNKRLENKFYHDIRQMVYMYREDSES